MLIRIWIHYWQNRIKFIIISGWTAHPRATSLHGWQIIYEWQRIKGHYLHHPFELLAMDDIRFAFIKHAKFQLLLMNKNRKTSPAAEVQSPINGRYTSMYEQQGLGTLRA